MMDEYSEPFPKLPAEEITEEIVEKILDHEESIKKFTNFDVIKMKVIADDKDFLTRVMFTPMTRTGACGPYICDNEMGCDECFRRWLDKDAIEWEEEDGKHIKTDTKE